MKTPKEWNKHIEKDSMGFEPPIPEHRIKQIQLDAKSEGWREGMTEAAEICDNSEYANGGIGQVILAAIDAKGQP